MDSEVELVEATPHTVDVRWNGYYFRYDRSGLALLSSCCYRWVQDRSGTDWACYRCLASTGLSIDYVVETLWPDTAAMLAALLEKDGVNVLEAAFTGHVVSDEMKSLAPLDWDFVAVPNFNLG